MLPRNRRGIDAQEIRRFIGPCPTILEVGSHDGSDTIKFLTLMPRARVFCFEPDQRAIVRFKKRLDEDRRVILCEKAVADVDGDRLFYASTGRAGRREDWDYSGSLCKPTGHLTRSPEIKFKEPSPVPCVRLDTWIQTAPVDHVHFMWADVQGSQRLLIAGAKAILFVTDYLYIEAHDPVAYAGEPTQEDLIDELSNVFNPIAFYAENILFKNKYLI